ncbi:MAG: hypothetical protein JNL08_20210 [Planctomycetes bacterium]|nr:hypothetical protein [Planctomycetota bacterium]
MKHAKPLTPALAAALLIALASCDGRSNVGELGSDARLTLQSVSLGRLVDVYAYQRADQSDPDRRNRFNRRLVLVAEDVVVNAGIESQPLFDATGEELPTADYEFLPFDRTIGHEELVILWDNRPGAEQANFTRALAAAQTGLAEVPASYRGQSTQTLPIPIVPRNAAVRLQFDGKVQVDAAFFQANPAAVQLLEFKGDPTLVDPADAFRVLPFRLIPKGDHIVLDTTILGGEAQGGIGTPGLPASSDSVTANIRVALPARGGVVSSFYVREDRIEKLNDVDSSGRDAVIRDFRSGNLADGSTGRLREPEVPMIVGSLAMGITAIDTATNTITLNKRLNFVPIRGRYPFVDGPLGIDGIPLGPLSAPVTTPLVAGDMLTQSIVVEMPDGSFETVLLRAEILQNLEVGTTVGETLGVAFAPPVGDSGQGERLTTARVRVASLLSGRDSLGREHSFRANQQPSGQDCIVRVRYYEDVPMIGASSSVTVSDASWRHFFMRIDPSPATSPNPGSLVNPNASLAIEFTKPMDLDQVDNSSNLLITNRSVPGLPLAEASAETFATQMGSPKRATFRVVPTRLADLSGDGTVLRLQAPMGFFHRAGTAETYGFHVRLGAAGVTDLAGTSLKIFDRAQAPKDSWSVNFSLSPTATENLVGWHSWRFEALDEDGTVPGSPDMFGQFRLENGRLTGAQTVRFSRSADREGLGVISRVDRGECWDAENDTQVGYDFTVPTAPIGHPGLLYWQTLMTDTINTPFLSTVWPYATQQVPQPVGRVVEPHKPQGSRMQMRYLEDDFGLDYRAPSEFAIDIEQLYWSSFNDEGVLYDVFDRYTMSLAHSNKRPDIRCFLDGPCWMDGLSMNSGLSTTFSENPLQGTSLTPVFEDAVYKINPNDAFRNGNNRKFIPYPRFDRTYTWRDSRLVSVDSSGNVIGLGGAQQPNAQAPNNDHTAHVDSPWIPSNADPEFLISGRTSWVEDEGDFRGTLQRDHDPIALPLLVDFKVFADSAANGLAVGSNGFQVAMLGSPSNFANPAQPVPGGYYDATGAGFAGRPRWPALRVHASGGEDLVSGQPVLIDPANQLTAVASPTVDAGLGGPNWPAPYQSNTARSVFIAPPGDGMLHWAHADFVRKVSTVTFAFFDTLQPQRAADTVVPAAEIAGFPDFNAVDPALRMQDMVLQMDPPQARQPAGTSVVIEVRGADGFDKDDELYDPLTNDEGFDYVDPVTNDPVTGRGNLLNVNYACEAYRYSTANYNAAPRVPATGLTRYVTEDQLDLIRNPATQLLPRFLNLRVVMTNNVTVSPALSPSLRSMSVVYRMQAFQ